MDIQLLNGDCLELMKDIPDGTIDMILCDLPYGTTRNKWDKVINLDLLWKQYNRIIKDNGAVLLFSQIPFSIQLGNSNLKNLRYEWIWIKENSTGHLNSHKMPLKKAENILVFYKKKSKYNPQGLIKLNKPNVNKKKSESTNYGKETSSIGYYTNYPNNILEFKRDKEKMHPTQKPVELLEYLIKTYTDKGETVLDNCMGVGSTGVATVNTNRKFIGIELDSNYFDIAVNRIKEAIDKKGGWFRWQVLT